MNRYIVFVKKILNHDIKSGLFKIAPLLDSASSFSAFSNSNILSNGFQGSWKANLYLILPWYPSFGKASLLDSMFGNILSGFPLQ